LTEGCRERWTGPTGPQLPPARKRRTRTAALTGLSAAIAATTNELAVAITRYSQLGQVILQTVTRAQCQPSCASQAAGWRDAAVAGRGGAAAEKSQQKPAPRM